MMGEKKQEEPTPLNDSPQQVEGPDEPPSPITLPPASLAASPKRTSSGKPQQEENDWDFDEQEVSLGSHCVLLRILRSRKHLGVNCIANWHLQSKLAHECMDRAIAMGNITVPLEFAIKSIGNQLILPSDGRLHARILKFEADQMRHLHVTSPDAVSDELESQQDCVTQELKAHQKLENSKADKRECSMV
jgi:hypothetical protein